MPSVDDAAPAYIARCKCGCGNLIFAAVDDPKHAKNNDKEIASLIRDGYAIERSTVGYVREGPCGFGCAKKKAKKED